MISCGPQGPAHLTNPILCRSLARYIPTTMASSIPLTSHPWQLLFPLAGTHFFPSSSQLGCSCHLGLSVDITRSKRSLLTRLPCWRVSMTLTTSCFSLVARAPVYNYVCVCDWNCIITVSPTRPVAPLRLESCVFSSPLCFQSLTQCMRHTVGPKEL